MEDHLLDLPHETVVLVHEHSPSLQMSHLTAIVAKRVDGTVVVDTDFVDAVEWESVRAVVHELAPIFAHELAFFHLIPLEELKKVEEFF